ncbi:hypothetical protein ACIRSU_13145 [Streptomyces sp. NPDC101160]|uniref:hypothetical protein n=1 Tax=Streptomyces sp. NPDC101160 TaxID=3366118 RepID=UPI00382B8844
MELRRRTWATERRRTFSCAAGAIALALAATGCSSGGSGAQAEGLCGPAADSAAGKALRDVLGTDDFTSEAMMPDQRFVSQLKDDLRERQGERSSPPAYLCRYLPDGSKERVVLDFTWAPADESVNRRAQAGTFYDVNGAMGEAGSLSAGLYVKCDLGGDLSAPASKAVLRASASLTVNRGKDVDKERETREVSFLYLMTRGVTDALGCENKPLAKDPVVTSR